MQKYADEFYEETGKTMASTREMVQWAIATGRWQRQDEVALKQCAKDFARAMREDYTTDSKGRRVRRKDAAFIEKDGKQITLWADSEYADREFMEVAFKQRRNQIVGDCY
jgi:hypothetical protein